jgi:superfamily II DNA/RNA helicase
MPPPSELTAVFREQAEAILREGRFQNFVAQSHSRDVLRSLHVPEDEWPTYTATIDEDLAYAGQTLLYLGLRLKQASAEASDADSFLIRGAEILEYIYARADNSDPERVCQLFTAALAYYMAGHFARAFVLVRDLEAEAPLPRFLRPIRHLLLKAFRALRGTVLDELLQTDYEDAQIATAVTDGELDEDQALCRVLEATLYRALSHLLEHVRTGDPTLLEAAEELIRGGTEVAVEHRFADWWWYFSCVGALLGTFRRHSLWTNLAPFLVQAESADLARRYVHSNLRLPTPVVELWPSQVAAVPHLLAEGGQKNLCVRMPTSAGKTKIAELAILTLAAGGGVDPTSKCVYVAPYRSLAVEIEQTLRQALRPLGLQVSELYGGFELTAVEKLLIEGTHVLVATPEKLDAFVRFSPDLAAQIRLVILDEGHIISPPNFRSIRDSRGLKYEVFLQRLVKRCERSGARLVFLSAVMPNAEQFAEWITGNRSGLVSSDWRPSRLMLGEVVWTGTAINVEFTHADRQPLGHRCFVPNFVTQWGASAIPGRRRNPFPKDGEEALALTALEFARQKLTMVFVAQKRLAEPFGRRLLECVELRRAIAEAAGEAYGLSVDERFRDDIDRCIDLVQEHMGEDSEHAAFLREGFVVHHSGLPQPVRLAMERLVRSGAVRLVVATTTLAQGVNFPIHTVLVHSLDHGQGELVSPMDFWNICGRAGRGMKENEGQVLFFAKVCFEEWRKKKPKQFKIQSVGWQRRCFEEWCQAQREERARYLSQYGTYQVQSGLLRLLIQVAALWKEQHGAVDVAELCEALANNALDLFAPSAEVDLEAVLSTLDGLLIAMTEECDAEEITPDTFQDLLCRSLVHLQLTTPAERQTVNRVLAARVRFIRNRHADPEKRRQYYQLGLPLRDCEFIERERDALLALYLRAVDYSTWSITERAAHLDEISGTLLRLSEVAPAVEVPRCARRILELWLSGQAPTAILRDPEVSEEGLTAHDLNRYIDDVFLYRLPWGLNSLGNYLKRYAEVTGSDWPSVCDYYSSFVKYGVHEPVVCWLLGLGIPSRAAAGRIAMLISHPVESPEALLRWLRAGGIAELEEAGLAPADAEMLRTAVSSAAAARNEQDERPISLSFRNVPPSGPAPVPGTRLLVERSPGGEAHRYRLRTLSGSLLCNFRFASDRLARWMDTPEFVTAEVVPMTGTDPDIRLSVRITSI